MRRFPIFQILRSGAVRQIGEWRHDEKVLTLVEAGFPFQPPGEYRIEGDLPWLFWDMMPSGYLGRKLQKQMPELNLSLHPNLLRADDCLKCLSEVGHDLSGNLIVGQASFDRFERWKRDCDQDEQQLIASIAADDQRDVRIHGSSLGGERPKRLITAGSGTGWIVKFSPPLETEFGRRWSDLLIAEELCAKTLDAGGISSAASRSLEVEGESGRRRYLLIDRYDRLSNFGRRGAATLFSYAECELGDPSFSAPKVLAAMISQGQLEQSAQEQLDLVHEFSRAIGNTDSHLGNYGLVFDDAGHAALAPFFDVLPMAFAPRNDEFPDRWIAPPAPTTHRVVASLVAHLRSLILADTRFSTDFQSKWLALLASP